MVNEEKAPTPPLLRLETLLALGLDQRTTENALVNSKVTANLAAVVAKIKNPAQLDATLSFPTNTGPGYWEV
ncbi:hypothetical protein ZWY2020_020286 [Hordeum vulgare]|nr:hypothetical protein ZWY2020_020286 [Hordeum vulgare]